jgi:hypothetical protein
LLANEFKAKQNYFYQQKEKDADLERQKQLLREYSGMGGQVATAEDGNDLGAPPYGRLVPLPTGRGGITWKNQPGTSLADRKFALAQEDAKNKQQAKTEFVRNSALDTLNTIGEIEKGMGYFGLTGDLPSIPGTHRVNWEANINKLLSGKIINLMTSMKEASKTGATGFGQLSEKELSVLQSASTALKRNLSSKDAQRYLDDMKVSLQKVLQGQEEVMGGGDNANDDPLGLR